MCREPVKGSTQCGTCAPSLLPLALVLEAAVVLEAQGAASAISQHAPPRKPTILAAHVLLALGCGLEVVVYDLVAAEVQVGVR